MHIRVLLAVPLLVLASCTSEEGTPQAAPSERPGASATLAPTTEPSPEDGRNRRPGPRALRAVGHEDFGGAGFNGDVWALGDHAYIGSYGGKTEDTDCPAEGVRVVDISDPRNPRMVSRLEAPPGTTSEDVVVRDVRTKRWRGPIAAVGIQACDIDEGKQPQTFRGLQFFDVRRPESPREISRWELPSETPGCHEIDLVARGERVLTGCAAPFARRAGLDEAYVIDVSDPRSPEQAFSWSLSEGPQGGVGCLSAKVVHNVRFSADSQTLYVSYWDAGTPVLDIGDLDDPKLLGRIEPVPLDPDGDNHSVAEIPGDKLIVLHEDFSPALPEAEFGGCGNEFGAWGSMRIYDIEKPAKPRLLSEYTTPNMKIANMETLEIFTAHNAEVVGRKDAFVSWYSDGIRWVDISDATNPKTVDAWVPPKARDPHGFLPSVPVVWGVYPVPGTNTILASDINSGLWILKARGL
jgi:hypothetical protein